jgi:hypothetical protein
MRAAIESQGNARIVTVLFCVIMMEERLLTMCAAGW